MIDKPIERRLIEPPMPLLTKPRTLGCLTRIERRRDGASLILSAFAMFDLAAPDPDRLQSEQALWLMVAKELPPPGVFDIGMPKPTAEILLGGHAAAPGGAPVERMGLGLAFGGVRKELLVTGDRWWRLGDTMIVPTSPSPFVTMPLIPERCFGGPGHPVNPSGQGFRARDRVAKGEAVALPNVEIPALAVRSAADEPLPAQFGTLALDAPERLRHAGTYDAAWLRTLAPGLAADADPRLFLLAPEDQRLSAYLTGDEEYHLLNFTAARPDIRKRLPGFLVRAFVGWKDSERAVVEVPMRIDTLWFFAGAGRGVLIHRGAVLVDDIEGADVADVTFAYERMTDEPRPVEHYLEVRRLRADPKTAFKYAFAEHQLTPPSSPDSMAARDARRRADVDERRRRRRESMTWAMTREMARSGVPAELMPATEIPDAPDFDLPLPLPEEIDQGEVDLAELLDAIDALQAREEAKLEAAARAQEPVMAALRTIAQGDAEPDSIDRLLALIGHPDVGSGLDGQIELSNAPLDPPAGGPPMTASATQAMALAGDWRRAVLNAAAPAVDEDEQFAQARARFMEEPAGSPLASIRKELTPERFKLPDLPGVDRDALLPPSPATDADPLVEALNALDHPLAPPGARDALEREFARASETLGQAFPGLTDKGRSPLEALLATAAAKPADADTIGQLLDATSHELDRAQASMNAQLDAAERLMTDGMREMRLASPQPLKPDAPLAPAVARRLGDLIEREHRAGASLAGRDLAGADLSGIDLSGADLSGALMEHVRLDGARLTGARLTRATLAGASLERTNLDRCDLTDTNLGRVRGSGASFDGSRLHATLVLEADMPQASFRAAELSEMQVMNCGLAGADFSEARIADTIFMRSNLTKSLWSKAHLSQAQFMDLDLAGAVFGDARFEKVSFLKSTLPEAQFDAAHLRSVGFAGEVDLRGASFAAATSATLSFFEADLTGATFAQGHFQGLSFVGVILDGSTFRLCSAPRSLFSRNSIVRTDFFGAHLLEAQFNRANLTGSRLRAANLFGADLQDATLQGADLGEANLDRTIFAVANDAA